MPTPSRSNSAIHSLKTRGNRSRRGFTLTEVLIAIAIVVVLAGIVAVNVVGTRRASLVDVARLEIDAFQSAIEQFEIVFNRVPSEEEGLEVLWSSEALVTDDEADEQRWRAFIRTPKPNDPWDNPWNYRAESEYGLDYDLWSNGADGEEGTDDDITNWSDLEDAEGLGGGGMPLPPAGP